MINLEQCRLIDLKKIMDARGNLTYIEEERHIPFQIRRVYYLYDVPDGSTRAGHSHKKLHQFLISMSGSFTVELDDGFYRQKFHLNRPYYGLYIPPMYWRDIYDFSTNAVCLALTSDFYDESDYLRDYDEFLAAIKMPPKEAVF